ncbi:MAG: HNH endonuclease [Burkholderiaceae bacterium]
MTPPPHMPSRIPRYRPPRIAGRPQRIEDRPNAHERGYCDKRHKAWRLAVLTRDGWQCQTCGRICSGKREAHADHRIPIIQAPHLRYDVANGQCLCVACHASKTRREQKSGKIF